MTSTERVLALLDTHSATGYQCNRALRRIVEQYAPGPEPDWRSGTYGIGRDEEYAADHAVWQERTAILRAIEEELQ